MGAMRNTKCWFVNSPSVGMWTAHHHLIDEQLDSWKMMTIWIHGCAFPLPGENPKMGISWYKGLTHGLCTVLDTFRHDASTQTCHCRPIIQFCAHQTSPSIYSKPARFRRSPSQQIVNLTVCHGCWLTDYWRLMRCAVPWTHCSGSGSQGYLAAGRMTDARELVKEMSSRGLSATKARSWGVAQPSMASWGVGLWPSNSMRGMSDNQQ